MASSAEALRSKRFAECTPEELAHLQVLMSRLRLNLPQRRVRRTVANPKGSYPDLRRTLRRSMRSHESCWNSRAGLVDPGPGSWS